MRRLIVLALMLLSWSTAASAAQRSSTTNSGTSNTITCNVPASVATNDIVIMVVNLDNQGAVFDPADYPTGFTELAEADNTLDGQSHSVSWKRLTGADSGTYTFGDVGNSGQQWVCQAIAFSGRDTVNPPVISLTVSNNTANGTPVSIIAEGLSPNQGDDLLWIGSPDVNTTGGGNGMTPPSGYTEAQDAELGFAYLSIAYKENVAGGPTGVVTGSLALSAGAAGWTSWLLRIPATPGDLGHLLTEAADCINTEASDRLLAEEGGATDACTAAAATPTRLLMGVGT